MYWKKISSAVLKRAELCENRSIWLATSLFTNHFWFIKNSLKCSIHFIQ